jgi:hypothetical protein
MIYWVLIRSKKEIFRDISQQQKLIIIGFQTKPYKHEVSVTVKPYRCWKHGEGYYEIDKPRQHTSSIVDYLYN